MTAAGERAVPIPSEWCAAVIAALRSGDPDKIQSTTESDTAWSCTFPYAWEYQRDEALALALSTDGVVGRHITNMAPQCDAYEFFFHFDERKLLGKRTASYNLDRYHLARVRNAFS